MGREQHTAVYHLQSAPVRLRGYLAGWIFDGSPPLAWACRFPFLSTTAPGSHVLLGAHWTLHYSDASCCALLPSSGRILQNPSLWDPFFRGVGEPKGGQDGCQPETRSLISQFVNFCWHFNFVVRSSSWTTLTYVDWLFLECQLWKRFHSILRGPLKIFRKLRLFCCKMFPHRIASNKLWERRSYNETLQHNVMVTKNNT